MFSRNFKRAWETVSIERFFQTNRVFIGLVSSWMSSLRTNKQRFNSRIKTFFYIRAKHKSHITSSKLLARSSARYRVERKHNQSTISVSLYLQFTYLTPDRRIIPSTLASLMLSLWIQSMNYNLLNHKRMCDTLLWYMITQCFWSLFYSPDTQHGNQNQSLVTTSWVTYFIPRAHTGTCVSQLTQGKSGKRFWN